MKKTLIGLLFLAGGGTSLGQHNRGADSFRFELFPHGVGVYLDAGALLRPCPPAAPRPYHREFPVARDENGDFRYGRPPGAPFVLGPNAVSGAVIVGPGFTLPPSGERTDLATGSSFEEVSGRMGTPLRSIKVGRREVWVYEGFSLLFESGELSEIR